MPLTWVTRRIASRRSASPLAGIRRSLTRYPIRQVPHRDGFARLPASGFHAAARPRPVTVTAADDSATPGDSAASPGTVVRTVTVPTLDRVPSANVQPPSAPTGAVPSTRQSPARRPLLHGDSSSGGDRRRPSLLTESWPPGGIATGDTAGPIAYLTSTDTGAEVPVSSPSTPPKARATYVARDVAVSVRVAAPAASVSRFVHPGRDAVRSGAQQLDARLRDGDAVQGHGGGEGDVVVVLGGGDGRHQGHLQRLRGGRRGGRADGPHEGGEQSEDDGAAGADRHGSPGVRTTGSSPVRGCYGLLRPPRRTSAEPLPPPARRWR